MQWTDIELIAELLEEQHSQENLRTLRFTDLRQWILDLPGFKGKPEHCNERVLEAIQATWIELREEL